MKLDEVQQAIREGKAEFIQPPEQELEKPPEIDDFARFLAILEVLRRPKYYLTAAPNFTPKNFLEQIQFYKSGTTYRVYYYVAGSWKYHTLT